MLVLASGSPRRRELVGRLGVAFVVEAADIDETPHPDEDPIVYVERLARTKAAAVAGDVVLAADTTVALDGEIIAKPDGDAGARDMLRRLAARTHLVHTGVGVRRGERVESLVETTEVDLRPLTDREISWYVATGEPHDKAGGYGLQGAGGAFVTAIRGCTSNVIGLPLHRTVELLRTVGFDPLGVP